MKANRKFIERDDEAVSPVIAVILMVAITVVLAATVYVWVSGFGSSNSAAAKSMALTQSKSSSVIEYTVASASSGLRWSDIKFSTSGLSTAYQFVTSAGETGTHGTGTTYTPSSTAVIAAGDKVYIMNGATSAISGVKLTILDLSANSIMASLDGGKADAGAATDPSTVTCVRSSGTASLGAGTAVVSRCTLNRPIAMDTLAIGDFTASANSLGSSTITARSPTVFDINWATDATVTSANTLTLANTYADQTNTAPATAIAGIALTSA